MPCAATSHCSSPYVGRFAPSPTGPLHAGSLVAALASWLDARAQQGRWLVRIEDIDPPRCPPQADQLILAQLEALGLRPDEPPVWQSQRHAAYTRALAQLQTAGFAYPCGCTRRDIEAAWLARHPAHTRHQEWVYPGTCRHGLNGKPARSWRLLTGAIEPASLPAPVPALRPATAAPLLQPQPQADSLHWRVNWHDRALGAQQQDVSAEVGDFVLRRADGLWAYQLAVVVDDALQGITDVVRGADLADNTPRQLWLQRLLGLPHPGYLHVPLVRDARGEKLSKQHGAPAIDTGTPAACRAALDQAALALALPALNPALTSADALQAWIPAWAARWGTR